MISSLSQLNQMPYGGILKGKDIMVGLKTDYDKGKVYESLEGKVGDLKFKMNKLHNDLICFQTEKGNFYLNHQGSLIGETPLEDNSEYTDKSLFDYKA